MYFKKSQNLTFLYNWFLFRTQGVLAFLGSINIAYLDIYINDILQFSR